MINYNNIPKGNVLGFSVVAYQPKRLAIVLAKEAVTTIRPFLVAFADVHLITRASYDEAYGDKLRIFDLICPDGMPLVWLLHDGRTRAEKSAKRIAGPDIMQIMWENGRSMAGLRHFLLGGTPEMLVDLKRNLQTDFPDACLAGSYSPPFRELSNEENWEIADKISACGANIVWVGLGCPKQETWLALNAHILPPAVYLGVGAAFAFHSGAVKRAPRWMQKMGMEWIYRICKEPRRLFMRYIKWNFLFFVIVFLRRGK